jgi:CRP-like cAMP-binding protein
VLLPAKGQDVAAIKQAQCRNRLLATASAEDFALLAPHLEPMRLGRGHVLVQPEQTIEHVYFLESGIGSIVAISPEGQECEAGIFGFDSVAPLAPAMGSDRSPHRFLMQVADDSFRIARADFVEALAASASLRDLILRYAHVLGVQTSFTALSNAVHPVDERLARWLLMCHDRVDGDELVMTHEFVSLMLGVQRSSATLAIQALEGYRLIKAKRGRMTVLDREALEKLVDSGYGLPEAEYARLIEGA